MPYIEIKSCYENTIMHEIRNLNDELTGYDIAPIDGYVLHNVVLDKRKYNPKTKEFDEEITLGYSPSSCSVQSNYDFDTNPNDIYAVKKASVGSNGVIY